jgi:hypothetical protein
MPQQTPSAGDLGKRWNRDEDMKPAGEGRPPRPAAEPKGSEEAGKRAPTRTDPATGEPKGP